MAEPTMPYDHSMRLLVEREPATLLSYLLKRPIRNDEIRRVPAELTGPSVRLDTVFELGDPPRVLHMEFEINARPDRLHPRLLTYFERLHCVRRCPYSVRNSARKEQGPTPGHLPKRRYEA